MTTPASQRCVASSPKNWPVRVGAPARSTSTSPSGVLRFEFPPAPGQRVLRVAVRLSAAVEDQIEAGLERDAVVEGRRHVAIRAVTGILSVDDLGHPLQRGHDLFSVYDAVPQPVGDVL